VRCVQADDVAAAAEGATSDGRADPYRDWPTEGEAARLAGLSETHLKRLRNVKGGIRAVKRTAWVGNRVQEVWRHSPEDLERWRTLRESPTKAPHTDEAGLWYPDRYLHENQGHGLTALHKLRVRLLAERSPLVKRIDRSGSGCRGGKLWVLHQDALGLLTASPAAATSPVPANVLQPAAESRTVPGGRPPEPLPQQPYPVYIIQPKDLPVPVQQVECSYPSERPRVDAPPPASRPRWDAARRELWYGKVFCKRYTRPAEHQTLVLDSFEELGWPERIDDPLPPGKLRATIDDLNRALAGAPLHFCGDGTGEGMRWGARPAGE
jgi:hypothetical protein